MQKTWESARTFIYRNARPVELARWEYHFEQGKADRVLKALAAYQNGDGGFGHALEPDSWNTGSAPIQTWYAIGILKEIDRWDPQEPIVQGIIRYLLGGSAFSGRFWYNTLPENDHYPHAPWWSCDENYDTRITDNPGASLTGALLSVLRPDDAGWEVAASVAVHAVERYLAMEETEDHELRCYVELWEALSHLPFDISIDVEAFLVKLKAEARRILLRDADRWRNAYCSRPSSFIADRASPFYVGHEKLCEQECQFLREAQLDSGAWRVMWSWGAYPEEFAISARWWQCIGIIENLRFMQAMQ